MNLYLRLLWLIIRLPFLRKQPDALGKFTLTLCTFPNDLDINLHVNNGRYLTYMDLGRLELMVQTGLVKHIYQQRWMPVVGAVKAHFIRSLGAFERFTLTTQVIYWDEKWLYIEQNIEKNGTLYVTALFKALFITKDGNLKPNVLMAHIKNPPSHVPEMPEKVRLWLAADGKL